MAQTIEQQREADERGAAIRELKRQRAEAATRLAQLDAKLEQMTDADFAERLAKVPLSGMTLRERSETAARLGPERFERLVLSGRR
jgi:hypothetical protein